MPSPMNRYWIPNLDIHKKILTQELQYYLGPQATVRPYSFEGDDGFLITTPGPCLSDVSLSTGNRDVCTCIDRCPSSLSQEQIDDICRKSKDFWDKQAEARLQENPDQLLKRPLHQPVLVSRGSPDHAARREARRNGTGRRR